MLVGALQHHLSQGCREDLVVAASVPRRCATGARNGWTSIIMVVTAHQDDWTAASNCREPHPRKRPLLIRRERCGSRFGSGSLSERGLPQRAVVLRHLVSRTGAKCRLFMWRRRQSFAHAR